MIPPTDRSFRQRTLQGISWSAIAQLGRQAVQFVIGVILARLLSPDAFGLIGMILVFTGFAQLFVDMGLGAALIQKQDATQEHYSSVFWVNAGVGFLLMLLFMGSAPLIAYFYSEPALVPLTALIAVNFWVGSLGVIQMALLRKALDFRKLAVVEIVAVLFSGAVGIGMALWGAGVWSLAVQSVLTTLCTVVLLWVFNDWRPQFILRGRAVRELLGFSSNLLGFNTLNYWFRNADNLLIGRFLGTSALGIYSRAYAVMLLPLTNVSRTVGQVMFPALSVIQHDTERVANTYLRATRTVALITFPMMIGLMVAAESFVLGLFGAPWSGMIPVLRLFCIAGLVQSILMLNGSLYQSQARTDLQLKVGGAIGLMGVVAIAVGLQGGVVGVAFAYAVYAVVTAYPSIRVAVSLVGLSFRKVAGTLASTFGCAVAMGLVVWMVGHMAPAGWPHWLVLVVEVGVGALVYGYLIRRVRVPAYQECRDLLLEQWQHRLGRIQVNHKSLS